MSDHLPRRFILLAMAGGAAMLMVAAYCRLTLVPRAPESVPSLTTATQGSEPLPIQVGRESYVSSEACLKCHADQHKSWSASFHRTMTQVASPKSVVAPFEGVNLQSRGRTFQFERRGDEFWVTMTEPRLEERVRVRGGNMLLEHPLPLKEQRVVLATGSHIAQTYWVAVANELWQVPWIYHIEGQRWIPDGDSFLLPPETIHLNHNWNSNCIRCHTAAPIPGWTPGSVQQAQVAELGVACASCHGPGEAHVRFREGQREAFAKSSLPTQDPITNPAKCSATAASQICAQCHSSHRPINRDDWLVHGTHYRPGQDLEQDLRFHRFGAAETKTDYPDGYWRDGTCRTGGDEYLGLIASKCFEGGKLSCLSCHSLHGYESTTDQLKPQMNGNQACLQCHAEMKDKLAEHTHHGPESSGSQCLNCHMPHITYALFKGIRSHRIDSPSAVVTADTGRPNACNLCHVDQPLGWTASKLTQWYGQEEAQLTDQQKNTSAVATMALRGDAMERVIAAWHLGWEPAREAAGEDWEAAYLAPLLDDPYSVVRYVSYRSLKKLPGFQDFAYDFVAARSRRSQGKQEALELWLSLPKPQGKPRPSILLGEDGKLDTQAMEAMLKNRDDRRIFINE